MRSTLLCLGLVFYFFLCTACVNAEDCQPEVEWVPVTFNSPKQLRCGLQAASSYKWWSGAGCEAGSYQPMDACSQETCSLRASDYRSSALNYCCTSGSASSLSFAPGSSKCYSLSICPTVMSTVLPPIIFTGQASTVYLTVRLHPPSSLLGSNSFLLQLGQFPPFIRPSNLTHTSYPFTTFSFSFTATAPGEVRFLPDNLHSSFSECPPVAGSIEDATVAVVVADGATDSPVAPSTSSVVTSNPSTVPPECPSLPPSPSPTSACNPEAGSITGGAREGGEEEGVGNGRLLTVLLGGALVLVVAVSVVIIVGLLAWVHRLRSLAYPGHVPISSEHSISSTPTDSSIDSKSLPLPLASPHRPTISITNHYPPSSLGPIVTASPSQSQLSGSCYSVCTVDPWAVPENPYEFLRNGDMLVRTKETRVNLRPTKDEKVTNI